MPTRLHRWVFSRLIPPLLISSGLIIGVAAAVAIDREGNYTTQDFFPTADEYALSTWKVVAPQLNCRRGPGTTQAIVRVFRQGNPLTAQTAEGSHQNIGYLQHDAQGKPWMRVVLLNPSHPHLESCFVRANRTYIAPVLETR